MNRFFILFLTLIIILAVSPPISWADGKATDIKTTTWQGLLSDVIGHYPLSVDQANTSSEQKGKLNVPKNWIFDFGLKRFMMSHTSYEFGNPQAPFQKPLSRLEFPLNTWWLEYELRRTCPRWSIGSRVGLSVARNTDGRFRDSDWTNPYNTDMKTIYSESACRAEANYLFREDVDVNISDWLGLPPGLEIRPLFAFEFQRLSLMVHDGVQWEYGPGQVTALPGDGIHFRQDYYTYQIGLRGVYDGLKIGKYITIKATGEADWGPALGYNEDHHLVREGDRFTYEKTSGNSLYFSTGLDIIFAKTITAGITMDYLWIRTDGVHRYSNIPIHEDGTWSDGVKVWSDQTSLKAHVSYAF